MYYEAVKLIQQQLNQFGYHPRLKIDGYFGDKTLQAVKWFQAGINIHGVALQVDGIVGARTWKVFSTTPLL